MNAESPGGNCFPSAQGSGRDLEVPILHQLFLKYVSVSEDQAFLICLFKYALRYLILSKSHTFVLANWMHRSH